jgi:hypothetical protein
MKSLSPTHAGSFGLSLKRFDLRLVLLLGALLLLFVAQGLSQEATIVGTVTDPSGAAVANAKVTLTNVETGVSKVETTNDGGQYNAVDIHIGHYDIKTEASGFKTVERKGMLLQVGDRARADFQLQVGGQQETVTVEANTIAVQADTGEVSSVITGEQLQGLSVNGRGIYQLAALAPGASSQIDVTAPNTPVGGSAGVEFSGMRQNHNLYLLDGGENSDRGGAGGMSIAPSLDSIAEFRQLTSNYSADYGLSSGGTMTMVLKSGTKQFHAAAWEFNRNDAFDARTYNNRAPNPVAELRQNTFGFNVGGPVTFGKLYNPDKNRTFFFYNMEWRKYINGGTLQTIVPGNGIIGSDWYTGDLSSSSKTINVPSASQVAASVLFANCPGGTAPAGITQGSPFPGNQIPACMISPNATALLNAGGKFGGIFPAPTALDHGNPTFFGGNNSPTNLREEIVRIDHNFNSKFSVFGHFVDESVDQTFGTSLWNTSNTPVQGTSFGNPSYSGVIHTTYAISPTLLNEASFNYNGNRINIIPTGLISADGTQYSANRLFTGPNNDNRLPNINLTGSTTTRFGNNSWPWKNKADDYQIRDDISWTKGAHQMKMGGSWAIYKKVQDLFGQTQGAFNFGDVFTGLDFSDYLLGLSTGYTELAVQDKGFWNNQSWALYFQDNWRVNKRLTLNLGLRWDGVPHTYEAKNRMGNFYPKMYDPTKPAILDANGNISPTSPGLGGSPNPILQAAGTQFYLNGIGIPGTTPGVPKGLVNTNWAAFGPRIGFAYDLTGSGKTVFRGGFGAMYERIQGNDMYNAGPNVPFSSNVTFANVSLDNPSTFLKDGSTAVAPITVASITGLSVDRYRLPVVYQYSAGIQRSLASRTVLAVMYVGNQSRQQNYYSDINLPDPSNLLGIIGPSRVQRNTVNPYQGFGSINMSTSGANAHYNGLQVDLNSQIKRDLSLRVFYTLSRGYDPTTAGSGGGDLGTVSNPYSAWTYDAGRGGYDRLHNLSFNFIYDLPFMRNSSNAVLKTLVGGWEVSGIVTIESGVPYNVTLNHGQAIPVALCNPPGSSCGNYDQGGNGVGGTNRPDRTGSIVAPHTKQQWVTGSGFAIPDPGAWGNFPHNGLDGPGRDNWNLSLFKNFVFSEERGSHLELRLETFNTFNHPQIQNIGLGFGASDFGVPNSFFPGRIIQLGGKISF